MRRRSLRRWGWVVAVLALGIGRCTGRGACSEYAGATQIWINPFKFRVRVDLWQGLRADLNDHAFGAFDLLLRVEESRILLQRRQDRLIKSKSRNLTSRRCSPAGSCFAAGPYCFGTAKTPETKDAGDCKNPQENKKSFHTGSAIRCANTSVRI